MRQLFGRGASRRSEQVQISHLKSPISAAALLSLILPMTAPAASPYRLMTLDPGHFHASLVQKDMYPEVDPVVHVFAPAGLDLDEHLKRIERFNTRDNANEVVIAEREDSVDEIVSLALIAELDFEAIG